MHLPTIPVPVIDGTLRPLDAAVAMGTAIQKVPFIYRPIAPMVNTGASELSLSPGALIATVQNVRSLPILCGFWRARCEELQPKAMSQARAVCRLLDLAEVDLPARNRRGWA
eukprot:CAMPEP_0181504228 /NCGR_PEP_ID=MMETSP1110-20121109/57386_1 /TAXON_ID=174948 /ORGANISM="Symbiodinium sp., Strain CCMP421" /LENGTH=111 /DNA_ID=CAMNT_0023633079 /DNA_START=422 /DNA_END=753 /DNA_ORIENTATION=-